MLKRSAGPSKPSDLTTQHRPPVSAKKAAASKQAAQMGKAEEKPAASAPADEGECTCGAEVGKQLEKLGVGASAPPAPSAKDKAEEEYRE